MALRNNNRGAALVYVILTITLAAILTTGLMMLIVNRVKMLKIDEAQVKERYLAEGVVEICKEYASLSDVAQKTIKEYLGFPPLATTATEPESRRTIACYVEYEAGTQHCKVTYYGESYCTIIECNWSEASPSYSIDQTPRPDEDPAGGAP